jgi:hypothetical protein
MRVQVWSDGLYTEFKIAEGVRECATNAKATGINNDIDYESAALFCGATGEVVLLSPFA